MAVKKYLDSLPINEIAKYLSKDHYAYESIPFIGTPRKHPYDKEKIILIRKPNNKHTDFLEFNISDILHAEDLPSLVNEHGESVSMVKLWVRKGSTALKFQAFQVLNDEAI